MIGNKNCIRSNKALIIKLEYILKEQITNMSKGKARTSITKKSTYK